MNTEYQNLKAWLEETGDQPLEAMDAFFTARLEGYDEHMSHHWSRYYAWMAELVPEGTETLLDIGCGTGLELEGIYRRFPGLAVTGVDLSEAMLAKLAEKYKNPLLRLVQGDYFLCDLGENCFDAAVSFETLHHFTAEKKASLFAKLHRALKPGGVYLEYDYIAQSQDIEDLVFRECARRRLRDGIAPETFVHFDTPLTLEHELQAVRAGGFSQVEVLFLPGDDSPMIRAVKQGSAPSPSAPPSRTAR